ncbi:MAG: hypothetical protein ACJASQ_003103 [Crocinitomicaceae bacterium]|jgi:hypothetical protein
MLNIEIAKLLRKKGNLECTQKSENLENGTSEISNLSLRNLGLNEKDIADITTIIEQGNDTINIKSISFSYNQLIGDAGATLIAKKLPHSIYEIGLVGCGIGDKGGTEVLNWMRKSYNLQMICIEQNNFSEKLKMEFNIFKKENPKLMVVY